MPKVISALLMSLLFILPWLKLLGQADMKNGTLKKTAVQFLDQKKYRLAVPYYEELVKRYPKKYAYKYDLAECYLRSSVNKKKALTLLHDVAKEKEDYEDIGYLMGYAYMTLHQYDSAIVQFQSSLNQTKNTEKKERLLRLIENCKNGEELLENAIDVKITNLGAKINTPYREYAPVISTDEEVLIFTYRGEKSIGGLQDAFYNPDPEHGDYYEDIYRSYKKDSVWEGAKPLGENINTIGHDASIALSADGQILFTYRSDINKSKSNGQIYISHLKGSTWSQPELLNENINSAYWEGSVTMSADGLTLYFASDRPDGYGGKDLYVSHKEPDGDWGVAQNMGDKINTKYDDDAPFIHPNGKILYYASQGHNSIGNFDIFTSIKDKNDEWRMPINVGYPVNTAADDIYYVVSADGKHGYLSSDREGGHGEDDIYLVSPGLLQTTQSVDLVLLKGIVTANDTIRGGLLSVFDMEKNLLSQHTANEETGKFLVTLPFNESFIISIDVEDFETYWDTISTVDVDSFTELSKYIQIYSEDYLKAKKLKAKIDIEHKTIVVESEDRGTDSVSYDEIVEKHGGKSKEDIVFTVQVAAYKSASTFKYDDLKEIDDIKPNKLADGITRFELGRYNSLSEAEAIKNKAVNMGYKDAFVIGLYKGGRYTAAECLKRGLLD